MKIKVGSLMVPVTPRSQSCLNRTLHVVMPMLEAAGMDDQPVAALFGETGLPLWYVLDLTQWPEEIERKMLQGLPHAGKTGGCPKLLSFLTERTADENNPEEVPPTADN